MLGTPGLVIVLGGGRNASVWCERLRSVDGEGRESSPSMDGGCVGCSPFVDLEVGSVGSCGWIGGGVIPPGLLMLDITTTLL